MWLKLLLGTAFLSALVVAVLVAPLPPRVGRDAQVRDPGNQADHQTERRLRLLTWNIGNGDLETETRAHSEDLAAVAAVILKEDPDAVALQELIDEAQLKLLLAQLQHRYRGMVCSRGDADRVEAVLVKAAADQGEPSALGRKSNNAVQFTDVRLGDRFAAATTFRLRADLPEILLVSAHADAFHAGRRRAFLADLVDWTRSQPNGAIAFVAGDFNLEVSTRNGANLFTDDAKHDSEAYAYLSQYFRDLGIEAGQTAINDRRIDYIFGPAVPDSLRRAEVLRNAAVGRMDHWALLIEVGL
jgi:endonuclease/exonuclease/phosphatase family metal-dependent hydrolase